MPKWLKTIIAVLLLPVCLGAAKTLWLLIASSGHAESFWVAFLSGAACWVVIYCLLPKPMWVYVFGHELTHALWAWLFGGEVKRFKVTSKGGHVVLNKTNFLITLAPYFFPLYAAILAAIFVAGHLIWDWSAYRLWFHLLLGATYAFHVSLTFHILKTQQSDITSQGYVFSAVVVFLGNIFVLLVGLAPLLNQRLVTVFVWWMRSTAGILERLQHLF